MLYNWIVSIISLFVRLCQYGFIAILKDRYWTGAIPLETENRIRFAENAPVGTVIKLGSAEATLTGRNSSGTMSEYILTVRADMKLWKNSGVL